MADAGANPEAPSSTAASAPSEPILIDVEQDPSATAVPAPSPPQASLTMASPIIDLTDDVEMEDTPAADQAAVSSYQSSYFFKPAPPVAAPPALSSCQPQTFQQSPAPAPAAPSSSNVQSPAPVRTGTPSRSANGPQDPSSSRAGSVHPDPGFGIPDKAASHGDPVRRYFNTKVSSPLLDGMKLVAKEQPRDPLRVLGEFLLQRSRELEKGD